MPRPEYSKERVQEIQDQILEAALGVLREKGAAGMTLRAIAERMGWTPAALYRYFASKEALLAAVRAEGFQRFGADLERIRAEALTPRDVVREGIRAYLGFAASEPALFSLMYQLDQEADPSPGFVQESRRRTFDTALGLGEAASAADLIPGGANVATHVIWAAAHGLASLALSHQLDLGSSYEEIVEPLIERMTAPIAREGEGEVEPRPLRSKANE